MRRKIIAAVLTISMLSVYMGCGSSDSADDNDKAATQATTESATTSADAAVADAITASADANGNYAYNGSFENAELDGWTLTNVDNVTEELGVYQRDTDCTDGVQCLHYYSTGDVNFTAEQTLTGLESGTYKLSGSIQGDTAGDENASIYFYAVVNGETLKAETTVNGYLSWNTAELKDINIEDGNITIGVSVTNAPGGWGTIDNITLVKE